MEFSLRCLGVVVTATMLSSVASAADTITVGVIDTLTEEESLARIREGLQAGLNTENGRFVWFPSCRRTKCRGSNDFDRTLCWAPRIWKNSFERQGRPCLFVWRPERCSMLGKPVVQPVP